MNEGQRHDRAQHYRREAGSCGQYNRVVGVCSIYRRRCYRGIINADNIGVAEIGKEKQMKVTLKKLNRLSACPDGIEWFKSYTGNKGLIPLTKELIGVNVGWANWLITRYMTKSQCKKYITNPEIYDNASAYARAYASAYARANASAYARANAFADAHAYAYARANANADAYKKKLTEIVKWGIKILGGAK